MRPLNDTLQTKIMFNYKLKPNLIQIQDRILLERCIDTKMIKLKL